jgi:methylmalonyl-CoA/ethylmalonyl-CoA epimerase
VLKKRNNLIFNHFGIFVKNIKISEKHLSAFIEKGKSSKLILDKKLGIKAKLFYDKKKICYELVEPYGKNNPVSGFLKRGSNILNHIAYSTKNFNLATAYLKKKNYTQISKINYSKVFKGKIIFFLSPLNYIIEVIEDNK